MSAMSAAESLLSRLSRVQEIGNGRWKASCPGPLHEKGDRNPSLSIRELPDGTLLVKCHAGCPTAALLDMIGLELADLFPEPMEPRKAQPRLAFNLREALPVMIHEVGVVTMAVSDIVKGEKLSREDLTRVAQAGGRLNSIMDQIRADR